MAGRVERRTIGAPVPVLAAVCLVVAALTLLLPSTPTYDPWSWIIWGREILHLDLDTSTGPSWKPLPILFTTPFSLFGDAAPELWLVVARAGALLALLLAFRVARRLAGSGAPGVLAGFVAAGGLLFAGGWVRAGLLANSEGLLVASVLWAVERHLDGRPRQALVLGVAAALLRPEVWPFLAVYALWLWLADRAARQFVVALLLLVPALWFLPELWGSGEPLRASSRARNPDLGTAAFADRPALEVTETALDLVRGPILVGFVFALWIAAIRFVRSGAGRTTLLLGASAVAWVALVAGMTEAGYAGNPRYLVLAAALAAVCAGVGWARIAQGTGWLARRAGRPGLGSSAPTVAALVLLVVGIPFGLARVDSVADTYAASRSQSELYEELTRAVAEAGGPDQVLECGDPYTGRYRVPVLAWELGVHLGVVGHEPAVPGVVFRARGSPPEVPPGFTTFEREGEWRVLAACRELTAGPR